MRFDNNRKVLRLFLEGEINSYNADNILNEVEGIIAKEAFDKLVLDFSSVSYISSAGLRFILKLKQKYNDVVVVETSLDVYDIFNMTGFTSIMTVKKALAEVYLSGAQVIGSGYYSTVYRLNSDTIVKIFNHVSDEEQIERELSLSKEAFMLGIPTAISFDVVKAGDKLGVRFEMLDCKPLKDVIDEKPEYIQKYADLLRKMNSLESQNPNIPSIKDQFLTKLEDLKDALSNEQFAKVQKLLKDIPDRHTLVHGDCHFKNILVQNDELLLIDMETLSVGHPIFELASLYCAYIGFSEFNPEESMEFFGVPSEKAKEIYNSVINLYFNKDDEDIKNKIALVGYVNIARWYKVHSSNKETFKKYLERLFTLLDKYNDLDVGI